jgi:uncharacterized membrane protein YdjX (TVP38/TMEM64 family)
VFKVRRAFYIQLCIVAIGAAVLIFLSRFIPIVDLVASLQQRVVSLGSWSAICYVLLFALCNILLLPGGILNVGAGFFFGLWWGFALVFVGNAIGAAVSFGLGRYFGERWLRSMLARNTTLARLAEAVQREGWKIIVLSQLHPLFPTSLINYVYGLTRIRFRTFAFWVAIGRTPGLFLYAYLGTLGQFGVNIALHRTRPRIMEYWIWSGAFVFTALILIVLSRVAYQAFHTADNRQGNSKSLWRMNKEARMISG